MSLPFWKGGLDGSQRSISLHPPAAAKVKLQLQIPGKTVGLNMRSREANPIFIPAVMSLVVFTLGAQLWLFAMLFDMQQEKNGSGWY